MNWALFFGLVLLIGHNHYWKKTMYSRLENLEKSNAIAIENQKVILEKLTKDLYGKETDD